MLRTLLATLTVAAAILAAPAPRQELPLNGIAHVAYLSSDFAASAKFYSGILGYQEAFRLPAKDGKPAQVFFKVNDRQFIRLDQSTSPTPDDRLVEIAFLTTDIHALRSQLESRGLSPTKIEVRGDGNPYTSLTDPEGHVISFVEYRPDSKQAALDRKLLVRDRLSTEIWHTGVNVLDKAKMDSFYLDKLGMKPYWTGSRDDGKPLYVHHHLPGLRDNFFEYLVQYGEGGRERLGSTYHICLVVDDIDNAVEKARQRGLPRDERYDVRLGMVKHYLSNMFDPDGTRVEFMERHYVYE